MKAIYITSTEPYSGKSAVCLALGRKLQTKGLKIGYLKPVSTQPWRTPDGNLADEDAAFFCKMLDLEEAPMALSPVVITPSILRSRLKGVGREDLLEKIIQAAEQVGQGKDALILEGGASLREGYAMGVSNLSVAEALGAPALVMIRYHKEMQIIDDVFAAHIRLGDQFLGVIFNHVPEEELQFVEEFVQPYFHEQDITILGNLPSRPRLSALSVGELVDLLEAEVLTEYYEPNALAEAFTVGAMTVDAALSRFRRQQNKAVITGGDRADIQLAALETSTVVLILTGYLHPSPVVLHQAENLGVPVLLVKGNTMETVESIERAYGKTRLGQPEKLDAFMQLLDENVALDIVYKALGIDG
jgi:BioD-like phosphotransacetylase family protein